MTSKQITVSTNISASNGYDWKVQFQVPISLGFTLALWISRFLSIFLPILTLRIHFLKIEKERTINELKIQGLSKLNDLASQVSHDIRSPLASLIAVVHSTQGLSEGTRTEIRNSIRRIQDIANNLINQNKAIKRQEDSSYNLESSSTLSSEQLSIEMLSPLIDLIVSEKRSLLGTKPIEIDWDSNKEYGLFSSVQKIEFGRILSNLLNNSIDAMENSGRIKVALIQNEDSYQIVVEDNGKGMPPEVLKKLGMKGFSHGKEHSIESGSGLGVSHAMETVASWNGNLRFESEIGIGTKAIITLPQARPPAWFIKELKMQSSSTVIVLDDNQEIHDLWKKRFKSFEGLELLHFYCSDDIIKWFRTTYGMVDNPIYLCDYELVGSKNTGLEVIEMLGIAKEAILTTSRWDEIEIQNRCSRFGIKLLPKLYVPFVDINPT